MNDGFDRNAPGIDALNAAIEEWVWGHHLSARGRKTASGFQTEASKRGVHFIGRKDWLEDPRNQDGGEATAHPFRLYDFKTQQWNLATLLAIAAEPIAYERIHNKLRHSFDFAEFLREEVARNPGAASIPAHLAFERQLERYFEKRDQYDPLIADIFREIGEEAIENERQQLCIASASFERNRVILQLCRLMSDQDREKLCGPLAYAVFLQEMAESIRYVAESAFDHELPEEDMLGFGDRHEQGKVNMCGEVRMLDSLQARHHFLRELGLDFGLRAVCYVEGETELGALRSFFPEGGSVSIVDLQGQGATPRLRELLLQHRDDRVFTAMLLDADLDDRIREATNLAGEGLLTAGFALCAPDFEYGIGASDQNRIGALQQLWKARAPELPFPPGILERIPETHSGSDLDRLAISNNFPSIKGRDWGGFLADAVHADIDLRENHPVPFWDLVFRLFQASQRTILYETTVSRTTVNPTSGRLEEK